MAVAIFCGNALHGCETQWVTDRHFQQMMCLLAMAMDRTEESKAVRRGGVDPECPKSHSPLAQGC